MRLKREKTRQQSGDVEQDGGRKGRGHCGAEAGNMSDLTWARSHPHRVPIKERYNFKQRRTMAACETTLFKPHKTK